MSQREPSAGARALGHLLVADRSENLAGQYCGRLFADYGARVILAEPRDGSALRRQAPFAADGTSLTFRHLNTGKESVLEAGASLCAAADVILLAADDDAEAFAGDYPGAIVVAISDFGVDGPLKDWIGCELVHQALSGMMYNNGKAGREPLFGCGDRSAIVAGLAAYVAALVAVHARGEDGAGQVVRVDIAEVAATTSFPYILQYLYNGTVRSREEPSSLAGEARCRDSWICIWLYAHRWEAATATLGLEHLRDDPRFADPQIRRRNWAALFAEIGNAVKDRDAADLVDLLQKAQIISAKVEDPCNLATHRHLAERGYWSKAGGRRILGAPWRLAATPRIEAAGEPEPGRHSPLPAPRAGGVRPVRPLPLKGLRVTELTTAWSGPMAGRILAWFGAEVFHVEGPKRVNTWRLHHERKQNPVNFPDLDPGERPFDRAFLFNSQNVNKSSLIVDIKQDAGRDILAGLAERSDVLICNFRPGTLGKFGLDHATLAHRNPGLIACEMPAFGRTGPISRHAALGPIMEMATGMCALIGYPGGAPENTGPSYMDPVGGLNSAAAILTALVWRQRSGLGQDIEVPQVEAAMHLVGAEILAAIESGVTPPRCGNAVPHAAPHGAFPARGDEEWLAIACFDEGHWRSLCDAIDRPGLKDDRRFASMAERQRNSDALREEITAWSRLQDKHEAAALLQAAGLPAAPVQNPADLANSAYLAARGHFTELDHPAAGRHRYPGLPFHLSASPGSARHAAPCFGDANARVVQEILGRPDADLAELRETAGLVDRPAPL
ncbi:MAG: CoA transferase [Geminicoccaceae bacterium]|nr:CoA transferase [Geminicoccaceae bacterium]